MTELDDFVSCFSDKKIPHYQIGECYFSKRPRFENTYFTGERLGCVSKGRFRPGFVLLELLADTSRYVIINDRSEWLFLCGRNVLKEGVVSYGVSEGLVIVFNTRKEVLGYGKITGAGVTNLLDRGFFLRCER